MEVFRFLDVIFTENTFKESDKKNTSLIQIN